MVSGIRPIDHSTFCIIFKPKLINHSKFRVFNSIMADKSNSNMSSSNNDGDDDDRLKHAVELELSSDDQGWRRSVAASLRDFAESMMRREVAELEMMKATEAARIEAENRRLERETELTEMMLKTQLQITSFITIDRKRKRGEEDGCDSPSPVSVQREAAMLLSLLHFNLGM